VTGRRIGFVDVTTRDGHQSLWATRMTNAMILPFMPRMDEMGFDWINLEGGAVFDVCVRFLREDPWERMRLVAERVRHTPGDGVCRVDRPDQLAVVGAAPPQRAGRSHQLDEDLRPVAGVQHHEAHPGQDVAVHALHHLVGHLGVGGVPPPGEHVGGREDLLGEAVLRVVEGGGAHDAAVAQVLTNALGDRRVHALRVDLRDVLLDLLVAVLPPHGHADGGGGRVGHCRFCLSSSSSLRIT